MNINEICIYNKEKEYYSIKYEEFLFNKKCYIIDKKTKILI